MNSSVHCSKCADWELASSQDLCPCVCHYGREGRKDDDGKVRLDLLPPVALLKVGQVLTYGAKKYGPHNWRLVKDMEERYLAATLRHLVAHMEGKKHDPESGIEHLAHAACSLLFLLDSRD